MTKCYKCRKKVSGTFPLCEKCAKKKLEALKRLDKRIDESLRISDEAWDRRMTI